MLNKYDIGIYLDSVFFLIILNQNNGFPSALTNNVLSTLRHYFGTQNRTLLTFFCDCRQLVK